MSERLEWRTLYADVSPPGRETLFLDGEGLGDFYRASGDAWRVRIWVPGRLQGGHERLVLTEAAARAYLHRMGEQAQQAEGEAG